MKTHLLRWVSIALFLFVATLSVALHLTRAAHEPCRPFPEVCIPEIQPRRVNRSLVPTRTGESPQFYIDTAPTRKPKRVEVVSFERGLLGAIGIKNEELNAPDNSAIFSAALFSFLFCSVHFSFAFYTRTD